MNKEEKLDIINDMIRYYNDVNELTEKEKVEFNNFTNELKEAINYARCSTQLKTENKKLSYDEWKEKLNVQKVEETIYKKGEHFMTINDILEMYNEYCSSF